MTKTNNTTEPTIELVLVGGAAAWRCTDCGRWCRGVKKDTQIRHHPHCDLAHTTAVVYPDAASETAKTFDPSGAKKPTPPRRTIRAAAKAGTLHASHSDAEIIAAVRAGEISESDAMNQDL